MFYINNMIVHMKAFSSIWSFLNNNTRYLSDLFLHFASLAVDSDSDSFPTLKKVSKAKQDSTSKHTKTERHNSPPGAREVVKSPLQVKTALKSPPVPVQPKQTPTSVFDYFGSGTIQRSAKKLVASAKRKAVSSAKVFCRINYSATKPKIMVVVHQCVCLCPANTGQRWSNQWWRTCQAAADGGRCRGQQMETSTII